MHGGTTTYGGRRGGIDRFKQAFEILSRKGGTITQVIVEVIVEGIGLHGAGHGLDCEGHWTASV
jgi:hypothetical protein